MRCVRLIETTPTGHVIRHSLDRVEPVVKALIAEIAAERGLWPDQVAVMLASQLVLDEADDAAYRRVCERKGLLPL